MIPSFFPMYIIGIPPLTRYIMTSDPNYLLDGEGYVMVDFYDYQTSSEFVYSKPIPGLYYFPSPIMPNHFVKLACARMEIMYKFDAHPTIPHGLIQWEPVGTGKNSRQAIHYGYKYNYKTGNTKEPAPSMPSHITELRSVIWGLKIPGITNKKDASLNHPEEFASLNQCIINKYEPGQGISARIDHKDYADAVCCYTIGSGAVMTFTNKKSGEVVELYVEPNSLYVMTGESRWEWTHEMKPRLSDMVKGTKIPRGTRISITFRSINGLDDNAEEKDEISSLLTKLSSLHKLTGIENDVLWAYISYMNEESRIPFLNKLLNSDRQYLDTFLDDEIEELGNTMFDGTPCRGSGTEDSVPVKLTHAELNSGIRLGLYTRLIGRITGDKKQIDVWYKKLGFVPCESTNKLDRRKALYEKFVTWLNALDDSQLQLFFSDIVKS
jgi:alkylated DNA repair dioxygenase AlkB